jgi:hypothetical protein
MATEYMLAARSNVTIKKEKEAKWQQAVRQAHVITEGISHQLIKRHKI